MSNNVTMKEEKEISSQATTLDRNLEVQHSAIRSLREALAPVLRDEQPVKEEAAKSPPALTELGGQLRAYCVRLTDNTHELHQMLDDLEL